MYGFRPPKLSHIAGDFEPHFWAHTVLQFSHNYPTVQQALLALSVIYEGNNRDIGNPINTNTISIQYSQALHHYNLAVKHLIEYLSSTQQDSRATLLSCLVFVWIEILQNNLESAFKHLESGLKILGDIRSSLSGSTAVGIYSSHEAEDTYASLRRSFVRLRSQAAMHGTCSQLQGISAISTTPLEAVAPIPLSFTTVFESRSFLDNEINFVLGHLRQFRDKDHYASVDMLAMEEIREARLERIRQWHLATTAMTASISARKEAAHLSAVEYLELYYVLLEIILKALFSGSEMVFDQYKFEFERIIALVESVMKNRGADNTYALSFDMNIIPPLFFVALKCRVLPIRKQAVALLKRAPEREGIWRRDSIIKVCDWKIMMEEQGRGQLAETDMLPESARIFREHIPEADWGKLSENARPRIHFSRGDAGIVDNVPVPDGFEDVYDMGNML
jgi:hypothetical protein